MLTNVRFWGDKQTSVPVTQSRLHADQRHSGTSARQRVERELVSGKSELIVLVNGWAVGPWVPGSIADVLRVSRSLLVDSYVTYEYSLVSHFCYTIVVKTGRGVASFVGSLAARSVVIINKLLR